MNQFIIFLALLLAGCKKTPNQPPGATVKDHIPVQEEIIYHVFERRFYHHNYFPGDVRETDPEYGTLANSLGVVAPHPKSMRF